MLFITFFLPVRMRHSAVPVQTYFPGWQRCNNRVLCVRYIVLDNGLKALLISDYSGPAASEDEGSDGEDGGEEEEEGDDDESGDETEEESEEDGDDEDDENEAKKKRGNAEKQVFLIVEHGFTVRRSCRRKAGELSHDEIGCGLYRHKKLATLFCMSVVLLNR